MSVYVLGTKIDDITLKKALKRVSSLLNCSNYSSHGKYIVTPNPEICLYAAGHNNYRREVLGKAFLSLPDGFGLKIGARILGQKLKNRVTGVDFALELMQLAARNKWRVFLFGGKYGVAEKCSKVLLKKYKGLQVVGTELGIFNFQVPIFNQFSNSNDQIINKIKNTKPDILIVALGAPLQEKWITENLGKLPSVRLAVGVGGALDFISGKVKRAPLIVIKVGLEWLWRLIVQPWRAKRIFNATFKFLFTALVWRFRMWFIYRKNVAGLVVKGGRSSVGRTSASQAPYQESGGSSVGRTSASQAEDREFKSRPPLSGTGQAEVLLVERSDEPNHWQIPQGGVDKGEFARQAVVREMQEELGTEKLKIIKHIKNFHKYKWPFKHRLFRGYKGQKQDLFIFKFTGTDADIKLDKRELVNFKWVNVKHAVVEVHQDRKEQVKKAVSLLKKT